MVRMNESTQMMGGCGVKKMEQKCYTRVTKRNTIEEK